MIDRLTWSALLYAVLSLTVVRMLPVAISLWGSHARAPTVLFHRLVRPSRARFDRLRRFVAREQLIEDAGEECRDESRSSKPLGAPEGERSAGHGDDRRQRSSMSWRAPANATTDPANSPAAAPPSNP